MEDSLTPVLLLITLSSLLPPITTAHLTNQELSHAISALRSHSYTLFPKAVTESDLYHRSSPLGIPFYPLLRPTHSSPLSVSPPAPSSTTCHLSNCPRHTPPKVELQWRLLCHTLLPRRRILIGNTQVFVNATILDSVTVDGVRLSVPDLSSGLV
ncbi:uncharacterized protein LOC116130499 [Pistacia vera]|uniref:uncharacterized protein LOC116130499 n=1 Tax=Pistacia vera TaxID=55513 RepID=UPI0012636950|nr:uncharacterized protein LOC116130499 [Pistacia vera]